MNRRKIQPGYIPSATYRLQFNHTFTFRNAIDIAGYLEELGITDVYASPFLMARPGSMHGYDVTDPTRLNPEIGDDETFSALSQELQRRKMGLIADVVPNHMCISDPSNTLWWDVLENGPSSPFARFFDIDWHPPKQELANKVLLPVLGEQFGRVLENQEISVIYAEGEVRISVYDSPRPLAPGTWTMVLEPAAAKLRDRIDPADPRVAEFESIITALSHLPGPTESDEAKIRERQREKEIVKRRLSALVDANPEVLDSIQATLKDINGEKGNPRSFDRLERLLENQAYRLSYWRVAMDEINYRRFFDVNELAAIRVEDPEVFARVHSLIFDYVRRGNISGLRVDHPDGLYEPERYFQALQDAVRARSEGEPPPPDSMFYIVAEKILAGSEALRNSWPIAGTTGYDFLNLVNGLFVERSKQKGFDQLYSRFTGWSSSFEDLVCDSKRLILQVAMSSELNVLARKLDLLSEQHRWYRDFTLENLRDALREVLATFPVYRTYIGADQTEIDPEDKKQIAIAIREAKRRNPAISESVFDFIQSLLRLEHPDGLSDAQRAKRHMFVMRFQQLSSPVMAKGVEDTAFYRYYPLASLDEVGGSPERFGISANAFHRGNLVRRELWPNTMNASSTHDTKRGEDVRARINVLSEMPVEWYAAVRRWRNMTGIWKKKVGDIIAPDPNEEYLFYETLIGAWPLLSMNADQQSEFTSRMQRYMQKALNEAKLHTSWVNPNAEYNRAVEDFVSVALSPSPDNRFLQDFCTFQAPIARAGMWNSVSEVLLKIASPGVPDIYQGNELWNLVLVDPDNRQPVDYALRKQMLAPLQVVTDEERMVWVNRLVSNPCDGAIKLYVTSRALAFRKAQRELFAQGSYTPIALDGEHAHNAIAFARSWAGQTAIAIAGRFFLELRGTQGCPSGQAWANTALVLPKRLADKKFKDVITGLGVSGAQRDSRTVIPLEQAFQAGPFALLFSGN